MDIGQIFMDMRSLFTLVSFATFIGICVWAYSSRRKDAYAEAANLPFADDEPEDSKTGAHHG
ncbi:cbb3-type cytochrome c oxidase subunit 3 [Lacisediminimonas sp.]|uniref:cbb3-type cytochrome oxidase subunit 3 n=1 Tax=Lacisediminimonas sp. TaxID=3060582 RepID=UPI0027173AAA|nr:cbb3-type cytochrome c oxidase subunit 3 [Lacisediminimonas sp.]MDO8300385.1 cbb3-type cytochrome c oxidase subunit 3 [Lacisediminimonas sp.]